MGRGIFTYNLWTRSRDAVIIALARRQPASPVKEGSLCCGQAIYSGHGMERVRLARRTFAALHSSNGMLPRLIVLVLSASFSFNRDHYPPRASSYVSLTRFVGQVYVHAPSTRLCGKLSLQLRREEQRVPRSGIAVTRVCAHRRPAASTSSFSSSRWIN